eukprot:g4333.t1
MKFGANKEGHINPIGAGAAGIAATVSHDVIMTPMDVMKQRLQLGYYNGMRDCFKRVLATEGMGAFFVSFPTTLAMNVPYGAVLVASHESIKRVLNPSGGANMPAFLVSGALAGALAAAVTNPLDVVKTKLQTQGLRPLTSVEYGGSRADRGGGGAAAATGGGRRRRGRDMPIGSWKKGGGANTFSSAHLVLTRHKVEDAGGRKRGNQHHREASTGPRQVTRGITGMTSSNGLVSTIRQIIAEDGLRGFTRGLKPRIMTHAPAMGISWATYETMKRVLSGPEGA